MKKITHKSSQKREAYIALQNYIQSGERTEKRLKNSRPCVFNVK